MFSEPYDITLCHKGGHPVVLEHAISKGAGAGAGAASDDSIKELYDTLAGTLESVTKELGDKNLPTLQALLDTHKDSPVLHKALGMSGAGGFNFLSSSSSTL